MPISSFSQIFPPKSKYSEALVPDLTGKVAVVTGSNTGIGKETARVLLARGAKVYVASRSPDKGAAAIEELKKVTGKDNVHYLQLDLGNIKASKAAAEELMSKETQLHMVFNNAGVMMPPTGSKTSDGYELQWGTNVLGHYVFTETLLPLLKSTASASPADTVRIVTTSSTAHVSAPVGGVDLKDQFLGGKGGMLLYGQSKIGNVFMAQDWAERLKGDGIFSASVHPGIIQSDLVRHFPRVIQWLSSFILHPVSLGAITQLYAGTSPEVTLTQSGAYFVPWARVDESPRKECHDEEVKKGVMGLIREQVQAKLV